jgi:O-antigen/teichoic acid export membrane protein
MNRIARVGGAGTRLAIPGSGGAYLVARYGLSTLINLGNMLVLTWWIGPHAYGVFVTAVGIATFLASLTRAGVDTHLVRCHSAPTDQQYGVASGIILVNSFALLLAGLLAAPVLKHWYASQEFTAPYLALLLTLPLVGLAGPPMAKLERELRFRTVASIELGGQLAAFAVSAALAWRGLGVWAPVAGHVVWQAVSITAAWLAAGIQPSVVFDRTQARTMLSFGLGYATSMRVWQLRTLVNPLLVGRVLGVEAVAFVGLAIRLAEGLSFLRIAAGRISLAMLARLQQDAAAFRSTVQRTVQLQIAVLGPVLSLFGLVAPWVVPRIFGPRWVPALAVYPLVAAAVLANVVFGVEASALFVLCKQWKVTRAYSIHVTLLSLGACLLVPVFGIQGYGWAELVACAAYYLIHKELDPRLRPAMGAWAGWLAGFTGILFAPLLRVQLLVLLIVLLAAFVSPSVYRLVKSVLSRRGVSIDLPPIMCEEAGDRRR